MFCLDLKLYRRANTTRTPSEDSLWRATISPTPFPGRRPSVSPQATNMSPLAGLVGRRRCICRRRTTAPASATEQSPYPPGAPNPRPASSMTNTQSFPSFGGVKVFVPFPFTVPPEVAFPSRGLNHQTFLVSPATAPRLILTGLFWGR